MELLGGRNSVPASLVARSMINAGGDTFSLKSHASLSSALTDELAVCANTAGKRARTMKVSLRERDLLCTLLLSAR